MRQAIVEIPTPHSSPEISPWMRHMKGLKVVETAIAQHSVLNAPTNVCRLYLGFVQSAEDKPHTCNSRATGTLK